jgi:signal transduction histidine kinase/CheY-like chemotaxis protein
MVALLAVSLVLLSGALEMYFGYREARQQIARVQIVQAQAAADRIAQYLATIEVGLQDATKLGLDDSESGMRQRREEFHRLMVLFPAVVELQETDAAGNETLFISRTEPDRIRSGLPPKEPAVLASLYDRKIHYGQTYDSDDTGAEPFVRLCVPHDGPRRSVTVAAINLRFLGDVVAELHVGQGGRAYVLDRSNRLIAHPLPTHVLRKLDLSTAGIVQAARSSNGSTAKDELHAADTTDIDGQPAIVTAWPLPGLDWLVFVEQPRSEALAPALATLTRTILLVAAAGGFAFLASRWFARRMAAPIVKLRDATRRLAAGDLQQQVRIETGDEIEALAADFSQMAQQLHESYSGLENKVRERTAELAIRKEEAEQANAAKTRFLAAASHDLRQPMHSISLLVSLLNEQLCDPLQAGIARRVQSAVDAMEGLFGSLLDISKLDSGAVHPEIIDVDIGVLIGTIGQSFAAEAASRGLKLRAVHTNAVVRSDPVILERILSNLVANAIRYTQVGGVLIGARRRGDQLAVRVIDTGIGIEAAHLDHIFEEFYRVDAKGGSASKGLGLGLSIVHRSAQVLGHPLSVRSIPGRGSVFEVLLPQAKRATRAQPGGGIEALNRERLVGTFVAIVDDDRENRMALHELCEQWGCHVVSSATPEECIAALDSHLRSPDLLITDYRLGDGASGLDTVAGLRGRLDEMTPAIILTADVDLSQPPGNFVQVVHKPVTAVKLAACMIQLLPEPIGTQADLRG